MQEIPPLFISVPFWVIDALSNALRGYSNSEVFPGCIGVYIRTT